MTDKEANELLWSIVEGLPDAQLEARERTRGSTDGYGEGQREH